MRGHVLVLTLALLPTASAAADARAAEAIPIVLHMDGRIAVTVRINGAGPYRFRLDTGASRTIVSSSLAAELGLPPAGRSRTITQTGEGYRGLVRADEIAVGPAGDARAHALQLLVVPPEEIDRSEGVDGLLGQDVLSRWIYTIDYRASRLLLSSGQRACGSPAVRLPLARVAGGILAAVAVGGASRALHLVPDSGADRLVLFGRSPGALPPLTPIDRVRVRSVTGEASARLVRLDRLDVSGIAVGDHQALLLDDRPSGGVMGDGLLPLHLFGRVTFDLANSSLWVEPRR